MPAQILNGRVAFQKETEPVEAYYTPVKDYVVVNPFEDADQSAGGIVLPDGSKRDWESVLSRVVAVGPDVTGVKAGDVVLSHPELRARPVQLGGTKLVQIKEADLLGVILDPDSLPGVRKSKK